MFPLVMGPAARLGLLVGVGSVALSLFMLATTGRRFVLFFALIGPTVVYALSGAPRLIEVHSDRVVLRYWLRAMRTLRGAALFVQQMPDELVLVHESETYTIPRDQFPNDSFARCADAMEPMASRFLVQTPKQRSGGGERLR
jgi:hypothetical protein